MFKPLKLNPVERGYTDEWKSRISLYIHAVKLAIQQKKDFIKLKYVRGDISRETMQEEICTIESIALCPSKMYESSYFDCNELRTLATIYEGLVALSKDPNPFTQSNWEHWNDVTGEEKGIFVCKGMHQSWIASQFPDSFQCDWKIYRPKRGPFKRYHIDPKQLELLECDGMWWTAQDFNSALSREMTPNYDVFYLCGILAYYFNSPPKCQLGKCKTPKVCTSYCHRIKLQLWQPNH